MLYCRIACMNDYGTISFSVVWFYEVMLAWHISVLKTISVEEVTQIPVEVTGRKQFKKYGALKLWRWIQQAPPTFRCLPSDTALCSRRDFFITTALKISKLGDFFRARVHAVSFRTLPLFSSRPLDSPFCFSVLFLCYVRPGYPMS